MSATLPPAFDLADFTAQYQQLLDTPLTPENLPRWMEHWSDLEKQVFEWQQLTDFRKAQDVTHQQAARLHQQVVEQLVPLSRGFAAQLAQKLIALQPQGPEYRQLLLRFQGQQRVRTPELIALQGEAASRASAYDTITGTLSTEWEGQEVTAEDLWQHVYDPSREVREQAWLAHAHLWKTVRPQLTDLLQDLLARRRHMTEVGGFQDFRELMWLELGRTDYTPQDTLQLHQSILQHVVPLAVQLRAKRAEQLGLSRLRPWDLLVETSEQQPLQPVEQVNDLKTVTSRLLSHMSAECHAVFEDYLTQRPDLIDIETRLNKAPGGFSEYLPVSGYPTIFMSLVGMHEDLLGFLHETGHALHAILGGRANPLFWNQLSGMEFSETAAMTLELLPLGHLAEAGVYSVEQLTRAEQATLEQSITLLPRLAVYDAFQHWLYTDAPAQPTAEDLDRKWLELWTLYHPDVDFSGLEDHISEHWLKVLHIYLYPFYMIEYVMAQVFAFQVWAQYLQDPQQTMARFVAAMKKGGSLPLPELLQVMELDFPIEDARLRDTVQMIARKVLA